MKPIVCPKCGGASVLHYTDAYVVRRPIVGHDGKLSFVDCYTNEYDDSFFECLECGQRSTEAELIRPAA